jgi:hypothetical protein
MSMRRRSAGGRGHWRQLQAVGLSLLVAGLVAIGVVATAGATPPSTGSVVSNAAQPQAGYTPDTPFASGQSINVVLPANSAFDTASGNSTSALQIVECSTPDGVVPTKNISDFCDDWTQQGPTVLPNADGSVTYDGYEILALPDTPGGETSSPIVCSNTAATECSLYIGDNYQSDGAAHLWSQPFYISPSSSDSGSPAGDGSPPPTVTAPDPSLSTVVASPTTATADGVDLSTVTVTLLGTGAVPVSGKAVALSASSSTATVAGPSPALTNSSGQTTFTVTDTVAEPVTLTATDTTDSVVLTKTATVTFQAPVASASNSSVSASPTTVAPGGSTTITVTLRDQADDAQPVAGQTVTLSGTGSAVITPAATPNVTNSAGVVTFTATDTVAETVTFTATDTTESTVLSDTASVTFGNLTVSASKSTVTVPAAAPLGAQGTTATVTLLSASGSPVAGKAVSLQASAGTSVQIGDPSPATTDASGQVSFKLTDTAVESVTLTATDTTDSIELTSQPTVAFQTSEPSAASSTVTAPVTTSPADGETQTLILVTLKDQFGNPVSGKTVNVVGSPSGNVQVHPISIGSTQPGITTASGQAQFEADDSHAETVTFTATDTTDNLVLSQTVSITYLAGAGDPDSLGSTVTVSPANPPADGSTPSTITVTLTDYFSNPVAGQTITLAALNGSSTVTPASAVTDQAGQATFSATDATAEIVTYQATDVSDSNTVFAAEGVVTFGSPPAPPPSANDCSVVANPTSVPADGTSTATITVLLYDDNGDPVTGKTVTLTPSGGKSTVTATNGTTNNSGMATFTVSDATAESVTYTADDTTDSLNLTALPAAVTFAAVTAGSTGGTTTSTSTTSTTGAAGTTTTTVPPSSSSGSSSSAPVSLASSNTGNTGSGQSTLAVTGASPLLPWLIGLGFLFLVVGTIGRRRFDSSATQPDEVEGQPQ